MTLYIHDTEHLIDFEEACKQYYSGRIPFHKKATVLDSLNGEELFKGNIKQIINRYETI